MDRFKDKPAEGHKDLASQARNEMWNDVAGSHFCSFKPNDIKGLPPLQIDNHDAPNIEKPPKGCALPYFEEKPKNQCQDFTSYYHVIPGEPYRPPRPTGDSPTLHTVAQPGE